MAGHLLVDGFYRGLWKIVRDGDRATLRVSWFDGGPADRRAVIEEGHALLEFAAPGADEHVVDDGTVAG